MTSLASTTEILAELVGFPTVSHDSNLAMVEALAARLERAGARVEILTNAAGTKANLWATIGPDRDGGIVLSGHTDVVPVTDQDWASDPFLLTEREGLLYGRGTCDMKGFIAACVAMAPQLAGLARDRPLHFAFTHDEEVGCLGAQALVEVLTTRGLRPAVAIVGEPTQMRIIEGHKGCHEYRTHFHGLEGHGSAPDRGVNAVEYAARYVTRLLDLRDGLRARAPADGRFDPPWSTINIGRLSGGVAHNVIPGKATVDWEMRPVQRTDTDWIREDLARYVSEVLLPQMRAVHPGADISTDVIAEVDGLEPTEPNEARRIVAELTGANAAGTVPFCTEAGLFQAMGLSVVVCGPGSIAQAHKPDEFIAPDQLLACLAMLHRLGDRLAR